MDIITKDFKMPPFLRIQWANKTIKDKYEPMFERARQLYWNVEKETVVRGYRPLTTEHVSPHGYETTVQNFAKRGMIFFPIQEVGDYKGFASYHPPVIEGRPWSYYGVLSTDVQKASEFIEASQKHNTDHKKLGQLLDYPTCCIDSFDENFSNGILDGMWHQAMNTKEEHVREKTDTLIVLKDIDWRANIILRQFLVGVLFHTACSFSCEKTVQKGIDWFKLAEEIDAKGLAEAEMFLRMPYEWNCLKGIGYLKSPLFKASFASNFTSKQYTVQVEGSYTPIDAPKGLEFPFDMKTRMDTIKRSGNKLQYRAGVL